MPDGAGTVAVTYGKLYAISPCDKPQRVQQSNKNAEGAMRLAFTGFFQQHMHFFCV